MPCSIGQMGGLASVVIVAIASAGCSESVYTLAPVSGRVTCGGKPAAGGTILFTPEDAPEKTGRPPGSPGVSSSAVVGDDGGFTLIRGAVGDEGEAPGALIGPHLVTFMPPRTTPPVIPSECPWDLTPEDFERFKADMAKLRVYKPLNCDNSIAPGTVDVQPGENVFEFTLGGARSP